LAPLQSLTAALENVREHNLRGPLAVGNADDELGRLIIIFNRMNERLDASFERLREFTLHTSRELRAPLTLLCGDTEAILRDESLSPTEYDRAVRQLEELRRMTRMVESVTVLTQASAGQIAVVEKPVRWDELIRDNFGDTLVRAKQFGIRVELSARETVTVLGDRHWLRQLLLSLTENAVRFNRTQGNILMVLRQVGDVAEFSISNTGPGIPPEMLPKVFERFVRVGTGLGSTVEGCGLGLSIAQWIVRAHHGTITMESPDAELTTVRVRLPVYAPNA
jgi:signal transduction histidine kinase